MSNDRLESSQELAKRLVVAHLKLRKANRQMESAQREFSAVSHLLWQRWPGETLAMPVFADSIAYIIDVPDDNIHAATVHTATMTAENIELGEIDELEGQLAY